MTRPALAVLTAAVFGLCLCAHAAADAPQVHELALVIGANRSPSREQPALRYADDDGLAYAELLEGRGVHTELLTTPDRDTQEFVRRGSVDGPATLREVQRAVTRLAAQVREAHAKALPTRLYVFAAAHGDLQSGMPVLQLEDGVLSPHDLARLLDGVGARENHVVIDACYGAQFVAARGPGGETVAVQPGFAAGSRVPWPAHTGLISARSAGEQSHEWAEFQAGVFSHEVRSGLRGAADVNHDGLVSYRELSAFVERASGGVPIQRYRPEVVTTPIDGELDRPFADLRVSPVVLRLDVPSGERRVVENVRGERLADLPPWQSPETRLYFGPEETVVFVRARSEEREYRVSQGPGETTLSSITPQLTSARPRGAATEAFSHLFTLPFDAAYAANFEPQTPPQVDEDDLAGPPRRFFASVNVGVGGMLSGTSSYSGIGYGGALHLGARRSSGLMLGARAGGMYFGSAFVDNKDVRNFMIDLSAELGFERMRARHRLTFGPALGALYWRDRFYPHWEDILTPQEQAQHAPTRPSRDAFTLGLRGGFQLDYRYQLSRWLALGPGTDIGLLLPFYGCSRSEELKSHYHCKGGGSAALVLDVHVAAAF